MSLGPCGPGSQTAVGVAGCSRRWNSWATRCWFASRMRSSIFSRARADSKMSMSGSGCGIESNQCDESILGRSREIFCSQPNTPGYRRRTAAVWRTGSSGHRRSRSGHLLARTNVPPTQLRESGSPSAARSAPARSRALKSEPRHAGRLWRSRWLVNPWGTGGGCLPTSAAIRGVACSSIAGVPVLTSTTLLPAEARSSAPSPGDGRVVVFAHFDEVWEDSGLQVPAGRVQAGNP